jgi:hypothetical protein
MTSTANSAYRTTLLIHKPISAPSAWAEFVERCKCGIRAWGQVGLSVLCFTAPESTCRVFHASIPRELIVVNVRF